MRYLPIMALALGLVTLMGSWGRGSSSEALRQARNIVLVIVSIVALAAVFALAARRAL